MISRRVPGGITRCTRLIGILWFGDVLFSLAVPFTVHVGPVDGHAITSPESTVVLDPCRLGVRLPSRRTITDGTALRYLVGAPTKTFPAASTIAQKLTDGHETAFNRFVPSTRA